MEKTWKITISEEWPCVNYLKLIIFLISKKIYRAEGDFVWDK